MAEVDAAAEEARPLHEKSAARAGEGVPLQSISTGSDHYQLFVVQIPTSARLSTNRNSLL